MKIKMVKEKAYSVDGLNVLKFNVAQVVDLELPEEVKERFVKIGLAINLDKVKEIEKPVEVKPEITKVIEPEVKKRGRKKKAK